MKRPVQPHRVHTPAASSWHVEQQAPEGGRGGCGGGLSRPHKLQKGRHLDAHWAVGDSPSVVLAEGVGSAVGVVLQQRKIVPAAVRMLASAHQVIECALCAHVA